MGPEWEYQAELKLIREGVNDCEVGRRFGIPRGTIRDWKSVDRREAVAARSRGRESEVRVALLPLHRKMVR